MATEKIRINYEVDKKQLDASNKSLGKTIKANDLTQKEVDQTTDKFKKQEKQLSKTNKAFSGLGGQLTAIGNRFQIAGKGVGDMASGMFKVTTATTGTSKAMKILKVAIASTGIGLLIVAIGSLAAAFKSSETGQNKFAKIMDTIGVVVGNVSDVFANIGENIITAFESPKETINSFVKLVKENIINRFVGLLELVPQLGKAMTQLWSGDFAEAAETAGNAVLKVTIGVDDFTNKAKKGYEQATKSIKEFSKNNKEEIVIAQSLADKRAATNKLERDFWVKTAKLESKVADLRLKGRQEDDYTATQRLAFLNEANSLQEELINTELTIAKNRAEEVRIQNTFSKSTKENLEEEARLEAAVYQIEAKRLNQQRTLQREINTTTGQQEAIDAKIAKNKQDTIDKEKQALLEKKQNEAIEHEEKKQAISDLAIFKLEQENMLEEAEMERRNRLLENEELIEEERLLIIEESEAKITDIKQAEADNQKAIEDVIRQNKKASLNEILRMVKQNASDTSVIGKAAALTAIAIDTGEAIASLTKASEGNPANEVTYGGAGILQFISGMARIGLNIANAKSVLDQPTKFEVGGRIGGNLHSQGGTLIEAERDEFMMSRKATSKYGFNFMEKVNKLELNDLTTGTNTANINIVDVNPIAEQLKNMPQNIMNVDSEGFALHQIRGQYTMSQKIERYST